MRKRGVVVAAAMAMAIIALAGCSDDAPEGTVLGGETNTAEATPDSPTPTASPTAKTTTPGGVVVTGKGDKLDPKTEGELKAFVLQYLQAQSKATGNGDFAAVEKLITSSCDLCNRSKDTIAQIYASGKRVKGGVFVNSKAGRVADLKNGTYAVSVLTDVSPATIVNASGKTVGTEEGSTGKTFTYRVQKVSGSWRIVGGSAQS